MVQGAIAFVIRTPSWWAIPMATIRWRGRLPSGASWPVSLAIGDERVVRHAAR